jgi:steroid 5-alpha reductase family enzyme
MGVLSGWPSGDNPIAVSLVVSGVANALGYFHSALAQSHACVDLIGAGSFVTSLVATALFNYQMWSLRHILLVALVGSWSVRLTAYLTYRSTRIAHDPRFDQYFLEQDERWCTGPKFYPSGLAIFWIFQVAWVVIVMLPVSYVLWLDAAFDADRLVLKWHDWLLFSLAALSFLCEAVSDWQKWVFKTTNSAQRDRWVDVGLWRYSRHPNCTS